MSIYLQIMKIQMEIYLKMIKICLNYVLKLRPLIEIIKTRFLMEKKYNSEMKKETYQELLNIENGKNINFRTIDNNEI